MRDQTRGPQGGELSEVCIEVLRFLIDHPEAQDTAEGITAWWLLERDLERQTENVQQALAELVARGLMIQKQGADDRTRFTLCAERLEEVRRIAGRDER